MYLSDHVTKSKQMTSQAVAAVTFVRMDGVRTTVYELGRSDEGGEALKGLG